MEVTQSSNRGLDRVMNLRTERYCLLLTIFVIVALSSWRLAAAEDPPKKELPPLVVDTDSPLMLDNAAKKQKQIPQEDVSPSVAENAACFVCHENFSEEPLVTMHAKDGVGCVDCHGKSFAHRNDENNTTPPDVMFPRAKIDEGCVSCHDTHDAPAALVIERLRQRVPRASTSQDIVCTQCHGFHKLDHRTVVWDRTTRQLLTGSPAVQPAPIKPTLDMIKELAGSWVQASEDGQPTEKIVSTFRVTAGGNAVVEVLFPGDRNEMLTVYHQDGDDLFLTHYCAAQNQPRMRCLSTSEPDVLRFEFVDATNMHSADDLHMHSRTLRIIDAGHIESTWQSFNKGQPAGEVTFNLLRKK